MLGGILDKVPFPQKNGSDGALFSKRQSLTLLTSLTTEVVSDRGPNYRLTLAKGRRLFFLSPEAILKERSMVISVVEIPL